MSFFWNRLTVRVCAVKWVENLKYVLCSGVHDGSPLWQLTANGQIGAQSTQSKEKEECRYFENGPYRTGYVLGGVEGKK